MKILAQQKIYFCFIICCVFMHIFHIFDTFFCFNFLWYNTYAYLVLVDAEFFQDFIFAFNIRVRKLLRLLRSKKDFFIFIRQMKKYCSHSKTASQKPQKNIFYDFLRFIINNNCIFNYVIIFSCSLGGRPNSCFHNWAHESQFLFFFYCSPFVLFFCEVLRCCATKIKL